MNATPEDFFDLHGETFRFSSQPDQEHQSKPNGSDPSSGLPDLVIYNAGEIEVAKIQPREWLLGVSFCRKFLSGLIAEGGGGKTAIRYTQYLAAATGRNLTGEHVHVRCRVLIVCLEDDLAEVQRRIGAAMLHHGIAAQDVKGWLYYCTPRGLKLLQVDARGIRVTGDLYSNLEKIISLLKVDLVGLDPFVKAHGVEENDNNAIDEVCIQLACLADRFNCAIDVVHHARKGAAQPGDADRSRGASAMVFAGRLMRTVTTMSAEEAAVFAIATSERLSFVRVDDAKINLTPRSAEACWFQIVGVALGNTGVDPRYPRGDHVQTIERWTPPDLWRASAETFGTILDEIDAGMPDGRLYSHQGPAKDRAAWRVVLKHLDRTEAQARDMIKTWIKNGVLCEVDYEDQKARKPRKGLKLDHTKRPG